MLLYSSIRLFAVSGTVLLGSVVQSFVRIAQLFIPSYGEIPVAGCGVSRYAVSIS